MKILIKIQFKYLSINTHNSYDSVRILYRNSASNISTYWESTSNGKIKIKICGFCLIRYSESMEEK